VLAFGLLQLIDLKHNGLMTTTKLIELGAIFGAWKKCKNNILLQWFPNFQTRHSETEDLHV
jgi:hypothetical protein